MADQKIIISEVTPEDGQFIINSDRSHLTSILINLLENAIKHGRSGTIILVEIRDLGDEITLTVRNTSNNLIPDISLLSQEFNKQDFSNDGFGLGLWIVSRLAEIVNAGFEIQFLEQEFIARLSFSKNIG